MNQPTVAPNLIKSALFACIALSASSCISLDPATGTLSERLSFYGNGRLRGESTFDQTNDKDRHRARIRARAGLKYEVAEGLSAEARMSTATGDANNAHWDFGEDGDGDGFDGADVDLDRLFLTWAAAESFTVKVGKMGHAFQGPPVYSEFVWDGDVSPAGLAAIWKTSGEESSADVRLAGYVAAENNKTGGSSGDPIMIGAQFNLYTKPKEHTDLHLATSYYDWSNLSDGSPGSNQGNTDPMGKFSVWELFAAVGHEGGAFGEQTAFVQFMNNLDDEDDEDKGFALGAKFGPSGTKGDTNWFLAYYDLDANAVFSAVAQDDTPVAGTGAGGGMNGILAGIQHYMSDHVTLKLWGLTSDVDDVNSNNPYRIRLDLDFKVL